MTGKPDRNSSHLAGEYFVAAELYKRGYSVAITLGNAKAIDLFAERGTKTVNIQVKAIRSKKNVGWPIMRDQIKPGILYVLVSLNDEGVPPAYFILTSKEASEKVKQYSTRGIIDYSTICFPQYQDRWEKVAAVLADRK